MCILRAYSQGDVWPSHSSRQTPLRGFLFIDRFHLLSSNPVRWLPVYRRRPPQDPFHPEPNQKLHQLKSTYIKEEVTRLKFIPPGRIVRNSGGGFQQIFD